MGTKDNIMKNYMKDNAVFADAFNFYIYQGKQSIKPEDLRELDPSESVIIYESAKISVTEGTDKNKIGNSVGSHCRVNSEKQNKSANSAAIINSAMSSDSRHIFKGENSAYVSEQRYRELLTTRSYTCLTDLQRVLARRLALSSTQTISRSCWNSSKAII